LQRARKKVKQWLMAAVVEEKIPPV
jgi:hypothetical protein